MLLGYLITGYAYSECVVEFHGPMSSKLSLPLSIPVFPRLVTACHSFLSRTRAVAWTNKALADTNESLHQGVHCTIMSVTTDYIPQAADKKGVYRVLTHRGKQYETNAVEGDGLFGSYLCLIHPEKGGFSSHRLANCGPGEVQSAQSHETEHMGADTLRDQVSFPCTHKKRRSSTIPRGA